MKKKNLAKKMAKKDQWNDPSHPDFTPGPTFRRKEYEKKKGRGSLNSTMKHRIDVAGQDSYKEENT